VAVQGHSRSPIFVAIRSPYATYHITYTVSRTVSEFLRRIGQITAFHRGASFRLPEVWTAKFVFKIGLLETSSCDAQRYIEPFRRRSPVWRTDRIAIACIGQRALKISQSVTIQWIFSIFYGNICDPEASHDRLSVWSLLSDRCRR